jgi:hypothetical protein
MGRISRMKRDLIMEANKKLLNEVEGGPDLTNCHWFLMDVNYLDGKLGELHMYQVKKGFWRLRKYSDTNNLENFTEDSIEVPQKEEIEVMWDKDKESLKLTGRSLIGLAAYNKIFRTNEDEYSGKIIYGSDQLPSEYGIVRNYQYLHVGEVRLVESKDEPIGLNDGVKMKDGTVININNTYFIDKKLFSKKYFYGAIFDDEKYATNVIKCDKYDTGRN